MMTSRFGRIDRRRFVASSALGGAAILTAGQVPSAGQRTGISAALAQDSSADVPMFRGNAIRAGEMLGPGPDASTGVEVIWRYQPEDSSGAFSISSPAIVDGVVYVGSHDGILHALNAEDGSRRWQSAIGGLILPPVVAADTVYVGSRTPDDFEYSLYAVDANDGTERWSYATGSAHGVGPIVVNDVVYLGSQSLFALDAETGTDLWRFTAEQGFGWPVVVDGVVYVENSGTNLVAVNSEDGTERWRFTTGDVLSFGPMVVDGVVYAGSRDGYVYALNAEDGTERWRFATDSSSSRVIDGVVYVGSTDGNLYALNADDGVERWRVTIGDEVSYVGEKVDEVVCVSSNGYVCAVSADDGTERWRFTELGVSIPVGVDGVVYVGGGVGDRGEANLYAMSAQDGAELWHLVIRDAVQVGILSVVDGMVYAANGFGELYAIGARVPRLRLGGTARVAEKIPLRGGPAPTAVERVQLEQDMVVSITGEPEKSSDATWWPVVVDDTGDQGWVEASALEPLTSGPEPTATA